MILPERFPWYPEFVPDELKFGRYWVCCDQHKVPEIPGTYSRASSTNPKTWRSFGQASRAYNAGYHAGVGRIIAPAAGGFIGVDLDKVRDPRTRIIDSRALEILQDLDSFSEVSPSGRGVKVWIRASLDRSFVKPGLEIYRGGRYFCTTGQFLSQFPPNIQERQYEIDELVKREFPRARTTSSSGVRTEAYHGPDVEIDPFLASGAVEVLGQVPDGLGTKYQIRCPWIEQHTGQDPSGTYLGRRADGGLWFWCWHAHCASRGWREFKERVAATRQRRRVSVTTEHTDTSTRRVVIRFD
jgi:hypothetical protein